MSSKLREAIAAHVLAPIESPAQVLAARLVEVGGPTVRAVLFFGSRRTGATPDPWSAYDLFVLTSEHSREFYRAMRRAGALHRSDLVMTGLQRALPPSQLSFRTSHDGVELLAKLAVMALPRLIVETSPLRRDHFVAGRLAQPTALLYAASDDDRRLVLDALEAAHRETFRWARPWLPESFDVDEYVRSLLRVSFSWEIRPEPEGRSDALFTAQQDYHRPVYGALLEELAASGELRVVGPGRYGLPAPVPVSERRRRSWYFRRSIARSTMRWPKHVFTFEGWLDFIVRKARRHTGRDIELTEREKRMPLLFLWPRIIDYLKNKDRRGGAA